jgi:TonB-dependent SusC/RagA subfamily outer membrane receptor
MWTTPGSTRLLTGLGLLAAAACATRSEPSPASPRADSLEVGYGGQDREKVTGSTTTLSNRDVSAGPLQLEQLLRGKVAGLQITQKGNQISIRLRGTNSASIEEEPLVIVDGVMIPTSSLSSALAGLTPNDIKQVNVLKDVASTSIYGIRGAAGVIVITTKR